MANGRAHSVFDSVALREITGGDAEIEGQLAMLFCQSAESCIERLKPLVTEDKEALWPQILHEFKGAAANIHADKLAQLCTQAETLENKTEMRMAALANICQAYAQVKPMLEALQLR